MVAPIGIGLIGVGRQADWAHAGGIRRSGLARIVAVCDADADLLRKRARAYGLPGDRCFTRYQDLLACADVEAVTIATPNDLHAPIALAAAAAGKHILCEKPLALDLEQALAMLAAVRRHGVRHMTAFTYRFVPSMRYLRHLVGSGALGALRVVRSRRLMDFPDDTLGWRQVRAQAGSGELGDMASHRIDFAQSLLGPARRVQGLTRLFVPWRRGPDGGPQAAEVEDWTAFLAEFDGGAVGVFESCKLCRGYGRGDRGVDDFEVNGAVGSAIYHLRTPHVLERGEAGGAMSAEEVPAAFRAPIGAGAPLSVADPSLAFRENQMYEFLDAIRSGRDCSPSFLDGARAVAVVDAVLRAAECGRAVDVAPVV
jgi:predicted dehydrogenase